MSPTVVQVIESWRDACRDALRYDVRITLLAAGLIFLLALALGVWKYRQMLVSQDHRAHPYVDITHRAALLYSFATLLVAVFVQFSAWPAWVNLTAAAIVVFFFVGAILSYIGHGLRRDRQPIRRAGRRTQSRDDRAARRGDRRLRGDPRRVRRRAVLLAGAAH